MIVSARRGIRFWIIHNISDSMAYIRLTRRFEFEMAHALENYDGLCRHVHGHSYKLYVTVGGVPNSDPKDPKCGMVMDFTQLKAIVGSTIVDRLDHSLVLRNTAENSALIKAMSEKWQRIHMVDYQPTCEMMIGHFADSIQQQLPQGIALLELKLYETANSHATWLASDNR